MPDFVPGQRWINSAESQLGLGTVLASEQRTVTLVFMATGDTRIYAKQTAPLARIIFSVGDTIQSHDDQFLTVQKVSEHNGLITYAGVTENGKIVELQEGQLNNFTQLTRPAERLFSGQIDANKWFELRHRTLLQLNQLLTSELRGLAGCRTSLIPHQLYITHEVANRYAPRVLLADEVGLGKTIEAGLIIHHQLLSERAKRVLIIVPESLVHQWLVEMLRRFNLRFSIFDPSRCSAVEESTGLDNPFHSEQLVLCNLSFFATHPNRVEQAIHGAWDLVVIDEAHHLEWSPDNISTEYAIVDRLAAKSKGLLLLTATPEQLGKQGHFARLRLLDPSRFHDFNVFVQEESRYRPIAEAINALLSHVPLDKKSQQTLIDTINEGDNRALLETLQYTDLNHADNTAARQTLIEHLLDRHGTGRVLFRNTRAAIKGFPTRTVRSYPFPQPDQYTALELPDDADPILLVSPELIYQSLSLTNQPEWIQFDPRIAWLKNQLIILKPDKVLLITASAQTALDIAQALKLQSGIHAAVFHEGLSIVERDRAAAYFANPESGSQLLICSEIGSEGRNFQFAHHLVLFDLPLNPDLLEQRIGRLDRIGQSQSIHIYVPYLESSAQATLFHWFNEGLGAFDQNCPAGQAVFREVKNELLLTLRDIHQMDELIRSTQHHHARLNQALHLGRDRLLEYNSCQPEIANALKQQALMLDKNSGLSHYMDSVFDCYGVETEFHSKSCTIVRPGNHMLSTFPELPSDGVTITYDRATALANEDVQYLTWEHPMVIGAIDLVLSNEAGNTACTACTLEGVKPGELLVECLFVVEPAKISEIQTQRYLPPTTVRLLLDEYKNDRSTEIDSANINQNQTHIDRETAIKIIFSKEPEIKALISQAEDAAKTRTSALLDKSRQYASQVLLKEIDRLTALHQVNPSIRSEEIDFFLDQLQTLNKVINSANLRLDAIRVIICI